MEAAVGPAAAGARQGAAERESPALEGVEADAALAALVRARLGLAGRQATEGGGAAGLEEVELGVAVVLTLAGGGERAADHHADALRADVDRGEANGRVSAGEAVGEDSTRALTDGEEGTGRAGGGERDSGA